VRTLVKPLLGIFHGVCLAACFVESIGGVSESTSAGGESMSCVSESMSVSVALISGVSELMSASG
jgi:hypothetical protein